MERVESPPLRSDILDIEAETASLRVKSTSYEVVLQAQKPYIDLYDANQKQWASFFVMGEINTLNGMDEGAGLGVYEYEQTEDCLTVRFPIDSVLWRRKTAVWKFTPDLIETYFELEGNGKIVTCRYFGGNYADGKDSGFFPSQARFDRVFSPEPDERGEPIRPATEPAEVNVTGMSLPGRKDWIFAPAPYCFSFARANDDKWLSAGVAAPIEQQNFTGLHYETKQSAFSLSLDYEAHTEVNGYFRTPSILLHVAADPYGAIADYRQHAEALGYLKPPHKPAMPAWHSEPGMCGWGAADERSKTMPGVKAQDLSRQELYEEDDNTLALHGIVPGVKTIDDKWQLQYGTNEVDETKWRDMPAYIGKSHMLGQHVLLWFKAWDHEGVPEELCIRNRHNIPVSVDPSNPEYADFLRQQIERMLSPKGYNADGFKIDFTARTPSGVYLESYGDIWGTALLHRLMKIIHDTAKSVKPDALIVDHAPNPWFRDVADVKRNNDVFTHLPIISQMQHRSMVAQAACPEALIDTDNWPMNSKAEWRRYLQIQDKIGVPWLYFSSVIAGEDMTNADYNALRRSWSRYRKTHSLLIPSEKTY